ncbi:hypothetical protein FWK35_00010920 [Aphis craccivora]|uniref:Uncharacterized protein n=1 Tax=Aphis craccivora TaxID=307492 RepID=A0A6G0YTQ1_APHCR|nr:hypothetical protein FWK35_00010920 [Aphis craccivora]
MDLRPEWSGDLNHAYNGEECIKLVLAAKGCKKNIYHY